MEKGQETLTRLIIYIGAIVFICVMLFSREH